MGRKRLFLALGVGFLSASVLLLELLLTRLFSVVLLYHFAFMAVSVALLGSGVGGLLVFLNHRRFSFDRLPDWLSRLGLLLTGSILAVLFLTLNVRMPMSIGILTALRLSLVFLFASLPFVFAGMMLSLLVWRFAEEIHRIYFYDLVGAALGSFGVLPVLGFLGAPNGVLVAGLLASGSAVLLATSTGGSTKHLRRGAMGVLSMVALLGLNHSGKILDLRYAKGRSTDEEIYSRWNALSRVCVHPKGGGLDIRIDCDASTAVQSVDFWKGDRKAIAAAYSRTGDDLPQLLRPGSRTLVIGAGGGVDVARALAHGSPRVVAVEINPLIAQDLMLGRLLEASHRLYLRPEVEVVVDDARSAIRRSSERFDVIQATGIDTWASTAAGAFALSENYLYTVEAFRDYLSHLTSDGILAISRPEFDPPRQALRIVSLGRAALENMNIPFPGSHFIVIHNQRQDATVLIKRSPFTSSEIQRTRQLLIDNPGLKALYLPDTPADENAFASLLHSPDLATFYASYAYDIRPTSDSWPFFFFTARLSHWGEIFGAAAEDLRNNVALFILLVLMVLSGTSVLFLLWLPRRFGDRSAAAAANPARWTYFLAIGVGYITIEMVLLQSFILFMGHPTYGLTVVVFSLLVGSGLGSRWSSRLPSSSLVCRTVPFLLVGGLALGSLFLFPQLSQSFQGLPRLERGLISVLVVFPFGFVMGIPFPAGIRSCDAREQNAVPWYWSANAAGSVFGSVLAVVLAISYGIPWTGLAGAACYAIAGLAALRLGERPIPIPAAEPIPQGAK